MNRITGLFNIHYPIIQAGMIWCSGWRLASAVSEAGGLGLIGAGSMYPDVLEEHIIKCKAATSRTFGINVPLLYPQVDKLMAMIVRYNVPVVVTSAGNPMKWTLYLKNHGIKVVHVVANVKSALKCGEAGVDAIVAEGFEAGGHNGREETTSMVLIPLVRDATDLPLIAAGGISSGKAMAAALALGAEGVQVGSRFAASEESSAHPAFKQKVLKTGDGGTLLTLRKVMPVRLVHNNFSAQVQKMEDEGATTEQLREYLGHGRAKRGMFEGELDEGELEIGQVAALIDKVKPARAIIEEMMHEYRETINTLNTFIF